MDYVEQKIYIESKTHLKIPNVFVLDIELTIFPLWLYFFNVNRSLRENKMCVLQFYEI